MKYIQILAMITAYSRSGICQANDIVGIDFGNENTKIAYKLEDSDEHGFVQVPSYVSFFGSED